MRAAVSGDCRAAEPRSAVPPGPFLARIRTALGSVRGAVGNRRHPPTAGAESVLIPRRTEGGPPHAGVGRPVLVSALSETCRLVPVVSGPRAESVLIPATHWSRPIAIGLGHNRSRSRGTGAAERAGERTGTATVGPGRYEPPPCCWMPAPSTCGSRRPGPSRAVIAGPGVLSAAVCASDGKRAIRASTRHVPAVDPRACLRVEKTQTGG